MTRNFVSSYRSVPPVLLLPALAISLRGLSRPVFFASRALDGRPTDTRTRPMFRKRARRPAFESLETRQLLAADSITLNGDVLHIRGTNRADFIDVQRVTSGPMTGMVQVTLNSEQKFFEYDYNGTGTGSITGVVINGRRGNDQISISDNVYFPAVINGGRGSDTIASGVGNDTIDGGRGNDTIVGSQGDDSILGGRGVDNIQAGEGNDTGAGGRGNDLLNGGDGDDALAGDAGNDEVQGEAGQDTC